MDRIWETFMNWLCKTCRHLVEDKKGSIAIVFALTATMVLGIIGGAVDFGRALSQRVKLQASVDAAAMAGARALAMEQGDGVTQAGNVFAANFPGVTPQVNVDGGKVSVNAGASVPSHLLQFMGLPTLNVSAAAAAEPSFETVVTPPEPGGDVCILLMDSYKHQSLLVNGSAYTSAPSCEVHVRSTRMNEAAIINSNVHYDVKRICVAGNTRLHGGGNGVVGPIEDNCNTASDPFAGTLPVPAIEACKPSQNFNGRTANLTPGTYCGNWNFNGNIKTINLAPGVYVLKNSRWTFNGKLQGSDVTVYLADSNSYWQLNGQGSINIQAPETGTYAGLLMYEPPGLANLTQITVNGGSNSVISGLVYLPSRDMTWNGNSGVEADKLTMVFNSLLVNGNTTWKVQPFTSRGIQAPGSGGSTTQRLSSIKLTYN
jgi:hypothetical protein